MANQKNKLKPVSENKNEIKKNEPLSKTNQFNVELLKKLENRRKATAPEENNSDNEYNSDDEYNDDNKMPDLIDDSKIPITKDPLLFSQVKDEGINDVYLKEYIEPTAEEIENGDVISVDEAKAIATNPTEAGRMIKEAQIKKIDDLYETYKE